MYITAMDTAEVDILEPTGAELDLVSSKKKRKKKGSKSNGLQIQGYTPHQSNFVIPLLLESTF